MNCKSLLVYLFTAYYIPQLSSSMSLLNPMQKFPKDRLLKTCARSCSMNGRIVLMNRRCSLSDPSSAKSSSRLYHACSCIHTQVGKSFPSYIGSRRSYNTKLFSSSSTNNGGMDSKQNEEIVGQTRNFSDEANDCKKSHNNESDEKILSTTRQWIQNVVIGLNFCPFAERSMAKKQLFFELVRGDDVNEIVSSVIYHCLRRQDNAGTTVVICPDLYPMDFQGGYLDALDTIQNILTDGNLDQDIQIAPFHPLFEFQEAENENDIENFTNRSPYPIFHILREEEVAIAVKKLDGDSSKVYQRNMTLLQKMEEVLGREKAELAMKGTEVEGLQDVLKSKDSNQD